jgi:hypothetical protein
MGMRDAGGLLKRRGLVAGAVALVGAGLAKLAGPGTAEATHGGGTDPTALHVGEGNESTVSTRLAYAGTAEGLQVSASNASAVAVQGFHTAAGTGAGVSGLGITTGVRGTSNRIGVHGAALEAGVRGEVSAPASNTGSGVVGVAAGCDFGNSSSVGVGGSGRNADGLTGTKTGVLGITGQGVGVEGWGMKSGTGIRGSSNFGGGPDFGGSGIGVEGRSGSGPGVQGRSSSGMGIVGLSVGSYGVYGYSENTNGVVGGSGGNGAALVGFTQNGIGVFGGVTGGGGGLAGYFDGAVFVKSLTVAGGAKSAAVKKRDGTHARMYCQESPEPWFEDFGTAELKYGQASVALDAEFGEVVDGSDYRVFLTELGDCGGLYVSRKEPNRFEVRSRGGAAASGSFDYRVVARRADAVGRRLEKVTLPKPVEYTAPPDLRDQPDRPGPAR